MKNKKNNAIYFLVIFLVISGIAAIQYFTKSPHKNNFEILVVGTTANFPPFAFYHDNEIIGFDIDIIQEALKRIGYSFIIKDIPFELLIPEATVGNIQVIAAGLAVTPQRSKELIFTIPYLMHDSMVIISLETAPIISTKDLCQKKIAVNSGYVTDICLSKLSNITVEKLPSIADSVDALINGYVDGLATSKTTLNSILQKYGKDHFFSIIIEENLVKAAAIAVSKLYPDLAEEITASMEQMHSDGTLEQLKQKWGL